MLSPIGASPVAKVRSSLIALAESSLVSVRIAVLALMFREWTIFTEVKTATKLAPRLIIGVHGIRLLCMKVRHRACSSFIAFNCVRVGGGVLSVVLFIRQIA
ncbi:hypothetical protein ACTXT7_017215, partial [Hymenolepis weldensis]